MRGRPAPCALADEVVAQRRGPGERQRQRRQQRHADRDRQRAEERAGDAGDRNQRQEDDDRRDGRSDQRHADLARSRCGSPRRAICPASRCITMFSTTTIASSITRPTAAARPPSVIRLKLSPSTRSAMKVTAMRRRNHQAGDQRRAPVAQEQHHDQRRQHQADEDRVAHAGDRVVDDLRLIVERLQLDALRQLLADASRSRRAPRRPPPRCCCRAGGRRSAAPPACALAVTTV